MLISHPEEGKESGLLERLISVLESRNLLLQGRRERSTFSAEESIADATSKISNLKSTLDHFEKWIGIMKVDARIASDKNHSPAGEEVHGKYEKVLLMFCAFEM